METHKQTSLLPPGGGTDEDPNSNSNSSPPAGSAKKYQIPQPPPPSPYSPFPSTSSSYSGCSNLSPIDMASLHSLSPGSGVVPGPPPPSPLNFSPSAVTASASSVVGEAGVTAAVVVAVSSSKPEPRVVSSSSSGANGNKILKIGDSSSYNDKSPIRRFFIPPTLEKKHSSGDLHSRLKTRKMLGVGETDNGDIHRSKISQVLGHNEHLYLKLPRGYWNWQIFLSAAMFAQAVLLILAPSYAAALGIVGIPPPNPDTNTDPLASAPAASTSGAQYYGAALLAFSFLLWKFLHVNDKMIIRATQFATLVHFSMVCTVDVLTALQYGTAIASVFDKLILFMFGVRLGICVICYAYLRWLGMPSAGLRRSPSYKEGNNCSPPAGAGAGAGANQESGTIIGVGAGVGGGPSSDRGGGVDKDK